MYFTKSIKYIFNFIVHDFAFVTYEITDFWRDVPRFEQQHVLIDHEKLDFFGICLLIERPFILGEPKCMSFSVHTVGHRKQDFFGAHSQL